MDPMSELSASDVPTDRHYDGAHHLWAMRDPASGRARIGIDAIGLEALGELAYVAIESVSASVVRGAAVGTLEAAKMTTSIAAPITGTIVARNDDVLADPRRVNEDPYGAGWLLEIEPSMWDADAAELLSGDAVTPWAEAEINKLGAETEGPRGESSATG